jgi:hypothetical protein
VDNGTGRMQVVRAALSQIVNARSSVSGMVQERHFADPTDATNGSDSVAVLGGWDHQFSSAGRFSLLAGPRVSSYRGLQPEINATTPARHAAVSRSGSITRTPKRSCSAFTDRWCSMAAARASPGRSAARWK